MGGRSGIHVGRAGVGHAGEHGGCVGVIPVQCVQCQDKETGQGGVGSVVGGLLWTPHCKLLLNWSLTNRLELALAWAELYCKLNVHSTLVEVMLYIADLQCRQDLHVRGGGGHSVLQGIDIHPAGIIS